jgi:hypothetical protein
MKTLTRILMFFGFCLLATIQLKAQAPGAFQYQAIVRDASGTIMATKPVSFRISILEGSVTGTVVYTERHYITTNAFGLVSLEIGTGIVDKGSFNLINWGSDQYFVNIELDPNGGNAFQFMGASRLFSVPYALHSKTVEIDQVDDADHDPGNEIQELQLSGTQLTLTRGGGTVTLPSSGGGDNWGSQSVIANATLSGNGTAGSPLGIADNGINSSKIEDGSIVTADLANSTVNTDKLGNLAVSSEKMQNGAVITDKLAANSVTTAKISDQAVTGDKIAQSGATGGQVLSWNGSTWAPATASGGGDNWGNQSTVTNTTLSGNGTTGSPLGIADNGVTSSKIMDGSIVTDDLANSAVANAKLASLAVTADKLVNQAVTTDKIADGAVTGAKIAQSGATGGQVLSWNGSTWAPATASGGGDNWGSQSVATDATLSGNGTASLPLKIADNGVNSAKIQDGALVTADLANSAVTADKLVNLAVTTDKLANSAVTGAKIAQSGATSGQVLSWNGSTWAPATVSGGGDNWGSQVVVANTGYFTGNGTTASPLSLSSMGASSGQVLKYNGTTWDNAADDNGPWNEDASYIYNNSSKDFGIGINHPTRKLTVAEGGTEAYLNVQNSSTGYTVSDGILLGMQGLDGWLTTYESGSLRLGTNGTAKIIIESGGDVGIGTMTPAYRLQVGSAGDGTQARANAWNLLSDARLKKNFMALANPLEMAEKINGYYFYWNTGTDHTRQVGFSAQEVREVLPEIVSEGEDGLLSVEYGKMTPLLLEAIKMLKAENDNLKARLDHLEAMLNIKPGNK